MIVTIKIDSEKLAALHDVLRVDQKDLSNIHISEATELQSVYAFRILTARSLLDMDPSSAVKG